MRRALSFIAWALSVTSRGATAAFARYNFVFRSLLCDLAGVAGCATVSYGVWLIYRPAGFIAAGLMLAAAALLYGRQLEAQRK